MKNNHVMKNIAGGISLITGIGLSSCITTMEQKPNIVLINIDDLGYKDLGFMGSKYYETPNVDKLASEGMVFTNAYASAANCAPSRASLMSGQYGPRHGVYTVGSPDRGNAKTRRIIATPNTKFIADSVVTLAEKLQDLDYVNCQIGKWHLGEDPLTQGFDQNVAGGRWGHPKSYFAPYIYPELEAPEGEYLTDRLTSEAIKFIEANKKQPFFLYLPYYTVHTPIQPKLHLKEKYKKKGGVQCQKNPGYAAMVENMDSCVGVILNTLDKLKLTKNTFVIFTSDNGGIRDISCQDPLRAGKGSYYEGGIRVPLIIKWPKKIKPGTGSDLVVSNIDFYPTILDILGVNIENKSLDGISIKQELFGNPIKETRPVFWHFPIYLQAYNPKNDDGRDPLFRTRPGSAMRYGNWKLHEYFEDGTIELYNLEDDIGERNNLANTETKKVKELMKILNTWREEINAPVPTEPNPEYDPEFEKQKIEQSLKKKTKK